jgi:AraC-like DNA-binding protein
MAALSESQGYLYKRIARAKLFVDGHFSKDIGIERIASEAFLSRFHFIRLFKRAYNRTPHQYLTQVRIERAKELLKSGLPVSDVCTMVGFESVSTFSGLFKRRVGASPSEYQARQLAIMADLARNPMKFVPGCFRKAILKN